MTDSPVTFDMKMLQNLTCFRPRRAVNGASGAIESNCPSGSKTCQILQHFQVESDGTVRHIDGFRYRRNGFTLGSHWQSSLPLIDRPPTDLAAGLADFFYKSRRHDADLAGLRRSTVRCDLPRQTQRPRRVAQRHHDEHPGDFVKADRAEMPAVALDVAVDVPSGIPGTTWRESGGYVPGAFGAIESNCSSTHRVSSRISLKFFRRT